MSHVSTRAARALSGAALALSITVSMSLAGGLVQPAAAAPDEPEPTPPAPVATTLALSAPARVVDEKSVDLGVVWQTADGQPVVGGTVTYEQRVKSTWKKVATRTSSATGRAFLKIRPRTDSTWRARGAAGTTGTTPYLAATSASATIDNVPPGQVLDLPGPAPTKLPAQPRASGTGANPKISQISNSVWRSMVGRSWHRGCPVGRSELRVLRVNYWGFDGYRHRGALVLRKDVARRAGAALSDMHAQKLPLRSMYLVDRFGWNPRLQGADDYKSMAADNTSAFNCRSVVNRPGVRSPHASGRAIDMNPWENPYNSRTGWVPNSWWSERSHPKVAWRSASHPVVKIWRAHGFRWTYGTSDSQHWDGRSTSAPTPRRTSPMGSFVG